MKSFLNPFRPGAGQFPPHLAGRKAAFSEFEKLLAQEPVIKNLVITGLRGVGKTVLLDAFKPIAIGNEWFWAGADMSESASVSEQTLSTRILADLASMLSSFSLPKVSGQSPVKLSYTVLLSVYNDTPGLEADKLKNVLELIWDAVKGKVKGIVLAYDEAQILKDHAKDKQYPLSLLLEVVQYLQRKQIPYLLILTGLPTLYPTLLETRTYTERMFHIITLDKLTVAECREAITDPIKKGNVRVTFENSAINQIISLSGGYPYFIQFLCKEVFDSFLQQQAVGIEEPDVSMLEIVAKLDNDFYSARWNLITERQKDLLRIIACLPTANEEFTVQDIAALAKKTGIPSFTPSYVNQYLSKLSMQGLVYKNSHGKYSFAVPMLGDYINRQEE